ncbi:MAG: chromosome segregation protein SMC [Desulfobacterales bacterium]|jgi:chromosome segregation protein
MKLKKLEITGFKSFYDKASIDFPEGISAVVGPNGCGKSNVADALRWVMGEQSVKQLRGKSMEDIIFSGTNGKPPLNMAEVNLTLANDNGSAPDEFREFTEIMLTRRLYRSGESSYLLNKKPCRLKDIHNVLLGSGMGAKSYAVIQQGSIGAFTDANPEERRYYVEEAAGTTRFKSRKAEALRKVQSTNQNLLRVSDIITEIKRQINSLKRQARKAERYKKYHDRIKQLDVGLALHNYIKLSAQVDQTDALLKELKDTDIGHTTQLNKLDAAVEEIKHRRWQKDQEISQQKTQKFEIQRNIDRMENDLAHLRAEVERLGGEATEIEAGREELEQKNARIQSEIEEGREQNNQLQEQIRTARITLQQEQSAAAQISEQLAALNAALETNKAELMDLTAQEARYKNIYQTASSNKESLKKRLKRIDEEIKSGGKKSETAKRRKDDAQKNLSSVKRQLEQIGRQLLRINDEVQEKNHRLGSQVKKVQTLEIEKNKAKSKYNALRKMEENLEWYKDGVKAILRLNGQGQEPNDGAAAGNRLTPDGILGLAADILEPEPSFATAVEAVLGESLQYVLVDKQHTALAAIDYLQSSRAGRSGFIPISVVKHIPLQSMNLSDSQNRLLDHVAVKPGFEKIAEVLLGHVVVATDLNQALEIYQRNGSSQTVVDKSGNIISPQGILIGGSQDKISGLLAKKHELKQLRRQAKEFDRQLETQRGHQKILEAEVRQIESALQQLSEQKNKAQQREIEAEKMFYKASEDLKHAQRYLEVVNLERQQMLGEQSDIDDEMAKYTSTLNEVSEKIKSVQEKISQTSGQVNTVSMKMEAFNQKIVDLKLKLTTLDAKLENSNNTLRRLREFQRDAQQYHEQLMTDLTAKRQKKNLSKNEITALEQTASEKYAELKIIEQTITGSEADYHEIDAKLKDNSTVISELHGKREKILEKLRLLELEQSQRTLHRDNIASRLEERYHKPFSDYSAELTRLSNDAAASEKEAIDGVPLQAVEEELEGLRKRIAKIGDVNLGAISEYEQLKARYEFLCEQRQDLTKAVEDLQRVIKKIDKITHQRFMDTFHAINEKLAEVFPRLFEGGSAKLVLNDPENPLETGVEYMIHPPGKKLTRMSLLSGGEKALAAIAFIFSLYLLKPATFCLMDEIDAPLDDANIYRFNNLLKLIGEKSQIVMITHNKKSMEFADTLFGITMESHGISKIVSVNFTRAENPGS